MPLLNRHIPNPFKSLTKRFGQQGPSAASLPTFLPAGTAAAASPAPAPKAARPGMVGKAKRMVAQLCKPSATPRVASAQQSVISAVVLPQQQTHWAEYEAALRTLATEAHDPAAAQEPDPYAAYQGAAAQNPVLRSDMDPDTEAAYQAALQGPAPYAAYASTIGLEQDILAKGAIDTSPAALQRKEADVKQAMRRLMDKMEEENVQHKSIQLDNGDTISASMSLDKEDGQTRIFTIQDNEAFDTSGYAGSWGSLREGGLWVNRDEVHKHSSPHVALNALLEMSQRLLA